MQVAFKLNANSTWHVIRSNPLAVLLSLLNSSSHALIYNLLPHMNLQSDNLCCFIFVLANDRGEIFFASFTSPRFNVERGKRRNEHFYRSKRMRFAREKYFLCTSKQYFFPAVYFSPLRFDHRNGEARNVFATKYLIIARLRACNKIFLVFYAGVGMSKIYVNGDFYYF